MGCDPDNGPLLNWSDYPAHLQVARAKLSTKMAGDFLRWLISNHPGLVLKDVDEADINILLLQWIGVDQATFEAEHADMLTKQELWRREHDGGG